MEDCYSPCILEFTEFQKSLLSKFALLLKKETLDSNKVFLKKTLEIAYKVSPEHKEITFDESSALLFSENALKF